MSTLRIADAFGTTSSISGSAARAATVFAMFVIGVPVNAWPASPTRDIESNAESSCSIDTPGRAKAEHVEEQRSRGCDSQMPRIASSRLTYEAAHRKSERAHRLARSRTLLRSKVHDEITLANTPSGTARSTHRSAICGVMRTKTREVS